MTIINFMPAHKQAPVALWLLKKDVAATAEKLQGPVPRRFWCRQAMRPLPHSRMRWASPAA